MAVPVKPGEEVTQQVEDVVIYELKFSDWKTNLDKPDDKHAKIAVRAIHGEPSLTARVVPPEQGPGGNSQEVRVAGGSRRGSYEIVRLVKSKKADETRKLAFTIKVV